MGIRRGGGLMLETGSRKSGKCAFASCWSGECRLDPQRNPPLWPLLPVETWSWDPIFQELGPDQKTWPRLEIQTLSSLLLVGSPCSLSVSRLPAFSRSTDLVGAKIKDVGLIDSTLLSFFSLALLFSVRSIKTPHAFVACPSEEAG